MAEDGAHISVEDRGEYLFVKCPPCHDEKDCTACLDAVYDGAKRFNKSRVLVDFTATTEQLPIMVAFGAGERVAERNREHWIQLAIVATQSVVYEDRFFETTAHNRGAAMKVFVEDFDAALVWLIG